MLMSVHPLPAFYLPLQDYIDTLRAEGDAARAKDGARRDAKASRLELLRQKAEQRRSGGGGGSHSAL